MFDFSLYRLAAHIKRTKTAHTGQPPLALLSAIALMSSLLVGCQPSSTLENETMQTDAQTQQAAQTVVQSDAAAAHIEQLEPVYVEQMQNLQQRLQAEYESLQAADKTVLDAESKATMDTNVQAAKKNNSDDMADDDSFDTKLNEQAKLDGQARVDGQASSQIDSDELTVLRRISAEPRKTTILTQQQIINSYQQTINALYQPESQPLDSEQTDTLINIAALIPQLFEHPELADRLNAKSPALARLIVQHQIWEQIEARQAAYMQEMKIAQQQEFESLMAKFNETIKDYDEQIAKYEQTLQEFQE